MKNQPTATFRRRPRERGMILIFALIVLVAMIMASVALVRSVDVTTQIAGNLAYRQSGVQAADSALESAIKFLKVTAPDLTQDQGNTYYATSNGGGSGTPTIFDPTTFAGWPAAKVATALPDDLAGNSAYYVTHRMCDKAGDPGNPVTNCFTAPTSASGNSNAVLGAGDYQCPPGNPACVVSHNPYYRITVRVDGPRNTVTYVQAVIY